MPKTIQQLSDEIYDFHVRLIGKKITLEEFCEEYCTIFLEVFYFLRHKEFLPRLQNFRRNCCDGSLTQADVNLLYELETALDAIKESFDHKGFIEQIKAVAVESQNFVAWMASRIPKLFV